MARDGRILLRFGEGVVQCYFVLPNGALLKRMCGACEKTCTETFVSAVFEFGRRDGFGDAAGVGGVELFAAKE